MRTILYTNWMESVCLFMPLRQLLSWGWPSFVDFYFTFTHSFGVYFIKFYQVLLSTLREFMVLSNVCYIKENSIICKENFTILKVKCH
jgi:hypothetical protein